MKMVYGILTQRIQPPGFVRSRSKPALYVLADGDVFVLHFIAEGNVFCAPCLRFRGIALRVIEVELHPATIDTQGKYAVGLQASGKNVEHGVRVQKIIQCLAAPIEIIAAFQWTELE